MKRVLFLSFFFITMAFGMEEVPVEKVVTFAQGFFGVKDELSRMPAEYRLECEVNDDCDAPIHIFLDKLSSSTHVGSVWLFPDKQEFDCVYVFPAFRKKKCGTLLTFAAFYKIWSQVAARPLAISFSPVGSDGISHEALKALCKRYGAQDLLPKEQESKKMPELGIDATGHPWMKVVFK